MRSTTPFPTTPVDVVALTVAEFTDGLDPNVAVPFDRVCHRFLDDANRAVVWFIRFRALTAWREREDVARWLTSDPSHEQHACQVAASFELNDEWEFHADAFRSAVEGCRRDGGR